MVTLSSLEVGRWGRVKARTKGIVKFGLAHKKVSVVVILVLLVGGWWGYSKLTSTAGETRYFLGNVERGTVVSTVSGSGQVSASNQLDVKPRVSGDVVYVGVRPGQYVRAGTLIVQIDSTNAQKSVRDATASLESAQIALEKLKKPATALTLTQAQNALINAQDALKRAYSDSHTDVTNAFLDLPNVITSLEDVQGGDDACGNLRWNIDCYMTAIMQYDSRAQLYRDTAYQDYTTAKNAYNTAFITYQALGSAASDADITKALDDSYSAVQLTAKAITSTNAFIQLYQDVLKARNSTPASASATNLTTLSALSSKINGHLSTLLSDSNMLKQSKQSVIEKQQSLDAITAGPDSLDLRSAELNVTKAQNALDDAKVALNDYYVRAPFDGTIAAVVATKYSTAGSGTAVATLITTQKMAELSLNEVDAAKVKVGNNVTLTFDALEDLMLTGKIAEANVVGTVTQGVVSYTVKVGFDTQDDRIKTGMTINANIQTDVRQDVLIVPSSAVKTANGSSYVLAFSTPYSDAEATAGVLSAIAPKQIPVETGITDDVNIEIRSGLKEGEQIVTRSVSGTPTTATTNTARGGAGGMRF